MIIISVSTIIILISIWFVEKSRSEKKISNEIIDNLPVMIWVMDLDLKYTYVNKAIENYGWLRKDFIGKHFTNVGDFSKVDPVDEAVDKYKKDPKRFNKQTIITTSINKLTNTKTIWESHVNEHIINGVVTGYKGVSIDITDRIKLEKMKIKYEKLKSTAEVGGAVCHEASQPATSASGCLSILKMDNPKLKNNKHFKILSISIEKLCDIISNVQKIDLSSTEYYTKPYLNTQIADFEKMSNPQRR